MNKKLTSYQKYQVRGDFLHFNSIVEITPDFEKALSKNFCAKKYFYGLPEYKQIHIVQKTKKLNEEQLKEYVAYLGNIM